jgi:SAM-dependent methyltransferase
MTTHAATSHVYTLGTNSGERTRLQRQADDLASHTLSLLEHVEVRPGGRALEVGCGPAGSIELLAHTVGPTGSVTAVDVDPAHVAQARQFVANRGLDNVEVIQSDARAMDLPSASFDLVHARLVLVNIPSPEEVVAEMVRVVKPGGWVVTDEADAGANLCYPPHPAWDRLHEILRAAYRSDGADLALGRKLSGLLRAAGLAGVAVEAHTDVYPAGHPRRTLLPDLVRSMRFKVVEHCIASEAEVQALDRNVRQHLPDPQTVAMTCLYFLAWGRRPTGNGRRG